MNAHDSSPYFKMLVGGDYPSIVRQALEKSRELPTHNDIPWIVAAFCFLGRTQEAKGLYEARVRELGETSRIASRFFLAVSLCREGRSEASKKMLLENARSAKVSFDPLSKFFHYQGFAFFRYTTGRLAKAQIWAEKSLSAAVGSHFAYGSALAFELLGHIYLSSGQFHAGFRYFDLAREKVLNLGQGALYQAIEVSTILYRASYGIAKNSSGLLATLEDFSASELFQDSYTQTALSLEIARVLILRGELGKAKDQLEAISAQVYKINNPDLEMDYNLQLAQLLRNRGEWHQALSLVRSAKHRVEDGPDVRSQLKVLGFEAQLLKALGRFPEHHILMDKLRGLTKLCASVMANRYMARNIQEERAKVRAGEDLLGDLIDRAAQYQEAVVPDILRGEWYSLLLAPLNVLPSECVLYFDAEPGSLTIFDKGDVRHVAEGCSASIRNLLMLLAQRPCSKENLANHLWRQSYNPLRHDGLIYPLIAKARKCLARAADWIEVSEYGYRLRSGVRVAAPLETMEEYAEIAAIPTEGSAALNARQKTILDIMGRGEAVEPRVLVRILKVSDATITRDMTTLCELGLALRTGRGRATRYRLETNFQSGERLC